MRKEPDSIAMVATKRNGHDAAATWTLPFFTTSSSTQSHHYSFVKHVTRNSTVSAAKDTVTFSPLFLRSRAARNTETCDDNKDQEQHEDCLNGELDHQEQTLELFPLRKEGFCSNGGDGGKEKEGGIHCFYEFLPLKN
ncbi:hypothetical protein Rs2_48957 [Raphanus sativus]|nr:hypothetical protein Rs2_48957 [Raphanus sativus]